jgi:hypothetical protein
MRDIDAGDALNKDVTTNASQVQGWKLFEWKLRFGHRRPLTYLLRWREEAK